MQNTSTILTRAEWDSMTEIEDELYGPDSGCYGFTAVLGREDSGMLADMLQMARMSCEDIGLDHLAAEREAFRRVALAQAIIAFGADFPAPAHWSTS